MENTQQTSDLTNQLRHQLSIARSEIKNLRQQVINLKYKHNADVEEIKNVLKTFPTYKVNEPSIACNCEYPNIQTIGKIESWFMEKRGVPRQGSICKDSQAILTLFPSVINNPNYALSGLEEYSHIWLIYYFHKNDSNHIRTKVAPPRLNGSKVGVFSTRSPQRPCPIGLSLVKIDKIIDNQIYFSGVDVLDGTPVLDIKPYIPQYDNPNYMLAENERQVEGGVVEETGPSAGAAANCADSKSVGSREAPDGEETNVKIPVWIQNASANKLRVEFSKKGLSQLKEFAEEERIQKTIIKVLEEDPRSVYLKQKLGSQFYTFSISDLQVTCKFDDANQIVTIYQVQKAGQLCECGMPEWQCAIHST